VALETLLMQDHDPAKGDKRTKRTTHHDESLHHVACDQVEQGTDPIAKALGARLVHGRPLLIAMLDSCVRTLCPHTQTVQREAYRPFGDVLKGASSGFWGMKRLTVDKGTPEEYFRIFARCGILPSHWVTFCKAFLWSCKTHSPYAEESDLEDLERSPMESVNAAFVSSVVAKPAILSIKALADGFQTPVYQVCLPRWWNRISQGGDKTALSDIGETFYRQLLSNHPELLDFFKSVDMDSLATHFAHSIGLVVQEVRMIGKSPSPFRKVVDHLSENHRRNGIPTLAFPIFGSQLMATVRPSLEKEEALTKEEAIHATADELEEALAKSYIELMVMISLPMEWEEKLIAEAKDFFEQIADEHKWSKDQLSRRWLEVVLEIQGTGTYTHTSEELQTGARIAWRNSAKCIGRISWNTLLVRDCRHAESAHDIFKEVEEHLRIATCGTNIQSVMSVFKPKAVNEMWGTRFWSTQLVRYAGYKNRESGEVLGDPANVDFTECK
jgi:hemoglobin-like flavoprotein